MWRIELWSYKNGELVDARESRPTTHEHAIEVAYSIAERWEDEGLTMVELDDPNTENILAGVNPKTGEQERLLVVRFDKSIKVNLPVVKFGKYAPEELSKEAGLR